jgi:hypothetical protein
MTDCYACKVAETHPNTTLRGPAGCMGCDSRALALVYGGMQREQIDPVMHLAWPDTKAFREGRRMFWNWVQKIEQARERNET